MPRTEHTTPFLRMLHWLPIPSRIAYKTDLLCHTALTTAYPKYQSELLNVYTPARPLRSSLDPNILNTATARTKSYGQRAFVQQGPINWNRVRGSIRTVEEKDTFKRHLKQQYFSRMHKISTFVSLPFYILFTISSCVHYCSVLFPCDCLSFWIFCYYNLYQSYQHVLFIVHVLSLFAIDQFKCNVQFKHLELFKIRRYIKCPLLLLLLLL